MRLDQQFRPFSTISRACVLAVAMFAFGMPLSAFGQAPVTPPGPPPPAAPAVQTAAQNPAVVSGTPLTMDEAVRMAMENNLGIRGERLNPEIQNYGVVRAQSAFTPSLFSSVTRGNSATPPSDFLSTGGVSVITSGSFDNRRGHAAACCRSAARITSFPGTDRARRPTRRARCSARSSDRT